MYQKKVTLSESKLIQAFKSNDFTSDFDALLDIDMIEAILLKDHIKPYEFSILKHFVLDWEQAIKVGFDSRMEYISRLLNDQSEENKLEFLEFLDLMTRIACRFKSLSKYVLTSFSFLLDASHLFKIEIIDSISDISSHQEVSCSQSIQILSSVIRYSETKSVILSSIKALHQIGTFWQHKKRIYDPLMFCLDSPDEDVKMMSIKAICTQIDGFWQRPVKKISSMILNDRSPKVRLCAATSLGDIGFYTSRSMRQAIVDSSKILAKRNNNLKIQKKKLEKQNKATYLVAERLSESKTVLKCLYDYIRHYECR